jgi:hypothetical protein
MRDEEIKRHIKEEILLVNMEQMQKLNSTIRWAIAVFAVFILTVVAKGFYDKGKLETTVTTLVTSLDKYTTSNDNIMKFLATDVGDIKKDVIKITTKVDELEKRVNRAHPNH